MNLYLLVDIALASTGITLGISIYQHFAIRRLKAASGVKVESFKQEFLEAIGKFKVDATQIAHDVERECSICKLKVNRYVANHNGTKIKCANCIGEGK